MIIIKSVIPKSLHLFLEQWGGCDVFKDQYAISFSHWQPLYHTCREGNFFKNTINILDTILFPLLQTILQACGKIPFLITELKYTQATKKQSPLKKPLFARNSISNRMPVSTKKASLFLNKLEFYRERFNDGRNQSCVHQA